MRLLLANLHFWPDTPPHAVILKSIAEALAKDNDVIVVASQPCYKKDYKVALEPKTVEMKAGYSVHRINLGLENTGRIFNKLKVFFGYTIFLFYKILKEKPDRTIMGTNPPMLGMFAVRIASKLTGGDYIYHCQDMHPEIAGISGEFSKGFLYKLLLHIEKKNCEQSFLTVVLSEDMKQSLIDRGCTGDNIRIINNFDLREPIETGDKLQLILAGNMIRKEHTFRLIFAGNIGRFQGLDSIIEVAKLLKDDYPEVEFIFLGDGKATKAMKELSGEMLGKTIHFFGHQPIAIARKLIEDSQLAIVSLSKDIYKYAFPSKTMTYLCEGVPLLCIVEAESSLARLVLENEIGITSTMSSPNDIANKIIDLYCNPTRALQMKKNASSFGAKHYSAESVLPLLVDTFCEEAK